MRVPNSVIQNNLISQLQDLRTRQFNLQQQLSTGQRIRSVADDPAAAERVLRTQSEKREMVQFRRNQDRVQEVAQASSAQLERIQGISARAQEIALLSSNVVADDYFVPYAAEANQLLEELDERLNFAYLGQHVFAGTATGAPPFDITRDGSGRITAVSYAGNTDRAEVSITSSSNLSGFPNPVRNADLETFFNNMIALRDALEAQDANAVSALSTGFFADENKIVEGLGELSSVQARIENTKRFDEFAYLRAESRISNDVDADIAAAATAYTRVDVAYQAALATSGDLMRRSLFDYI